ncbi:hypothetical protein AM571_CH01277 [Rhizobium etli 8C-3]|uniref:EF hand domain-containing protein n=2 Tax=Rhizobium TaxID=379 RepID=A0A4R3QMD6_9HYPH|nr:MULTISPECIES: hypothetical protein [Rhizobium]APO74113.1 hypothetical protein AM571_CH01277 [Rhizobium etli 8C-3]TCU22921.1 hypothetical protein EV130_10863 [Rhizobium azibense]TCU36497.1 hypothetical protein EV129_10762 [Rhizobium azibense]
MTHVSSVSETSYAYLATLSRLDANGDGVLSRGERAADEKPGIFKRFSEDDAGGQPRSTAGDNVLALMIELGDSGAGSVASNSQNAAGESDHASEIYRNTYGQYDLDIAS